MTEQNTSAGFGRSTTLDSGFIRVSIAATCYSFGAVMLLFSMAFFKDVAKLREIPSIVWGFICGAPNPDGPGLPLLLTLATLALLGGFAVTVWHFYRLWRDRKSTGQTNVL